MSYIGNNTPQREAKFWQGKGSLLVSALDAQDRPVGGYRRIGNCTAAALAIAIEQVERRENDSGDNLIAFSSITSKDATVSISVDSFEPMTLADLLYGDLSLVAGETGKTITVTAYLGRSVEIPIAKADSVTVTDGDGVDPIEYVEGEHYILSNGSIYFPAEQPEDNPIANEAELTVTLDTHAVQKIEGLVKDAVRVAIMFEGVNRADGKKPLRVKMHKVLISPTTQRSLISTENEFVELAIEGTLEASNAVTGSGLSRLFTEEHVVGEEA